MSRLKGTVDQGHDLSSEDGADKTAFVKRLHTILAHWPSADRLARAMGVSPSAFRKWLKGEAEPSRERLIALARAAGVGVAWLAEGEGPEPAFDAGLPGRRRSRQAEPTYEDDWGQFVVLADRAVPLNGRSFGSFLAVRQDWARNAVGVEPENLALDIAVDEAMAPTIKPRDALLIDTTERKIGGNGIYVLEIVTQRQIRRVQRRLDGGLLLISDNQAFPPDIVDAESAAAIAVLGRVVWIGRTI